MIKFHSKQKKSAFNQSNILLKFIDKIWRKQFNCLPHFTSLLFSFFICFQSASAQTPVISSFWPISDTVGSTISIFGSGFNTNAANNIVFFGATSATVSTASGSALTVIVPAGANYAPITVINTSTGLLAQSLNSFTPTFFPTKGNISATDFAPKFDLATGTAPYSLSIGDLNGDGKPDIAVANYFSNTLSVFRNMGMIGAISYAPKIDYPTGLLPHSVKIGDINGDGKPDLVVANLNSNTISVFRNTGSGGSISFAPLVDFATGTAPRSVSLGDLNGDGKLDLAVANSGSNTVSVLRNIGTLSTISFASKIDYLTGTNPYSVSVGDLNGDGKSDLAVANYSSNSVSVYRNTSIGGTISFATIINFLAGSGPRSICMGDLDRDGNLDLAVANYGSNTVSVFQNTTSLGSISFATHIEFVTDSGSSSVCIGDLDGDGNPDLAVANQRFSKVSLLRNTNSFGTVSFASKVDVTPGMSPASVSIGDLDGDGKPDIAVANIFSNSVSIIMYIWPNPPIISGFSPITGYLGTTITLTGSGFSITPSENIVFFGATRATVSSATDTSLIVSVPSGATYGPITVINTARGLVANSISNFTPTYTPNKVTISDADFAPKIDSATGANPMIVCVGDFNVDGKPDLAVVNQGSNTISIYRNIGSGTLFSFAPKVDFTTGTGSAPKGLCIGDLNGDGKPDLAVANQTANNVSVLLNTCNNGVISFAPKVDFTTGSSPQSICISDLDGNGKPDLAVTNYMAHTVSILRNIGGPNVVSFAPKVDYTAGSYPLIVSAGDLDKDGKPDLAFANVTNGLVFILRNTSQIGSISFASSGYFSSGIHPYSVTMGDLDGDGKLDLSVANFNSHKLTVLRNTSNIGTISFATKVDFNTGYYPYSVSLGDFNGDGKPDLAIPNNGSNTLSILPNTSNSGIISFAPKVDLATGANPQSVIVGDLNGDGKPDLAVTNNYSNTVSLIRNHTFSNNWLTSQPSVCNGSSASIIGSTPNGGNGTNTYSWLSSTTNDTSGFSVIAASNSINLTTATLTQNTWFKRCVNSTPNLTDTSKAILIKINQPIANNTSTGIQSICSNSAPDTLYGSIPTGGNGTTYNYKWLKSTLSANAGFMPAGLNDSAINFSPSYLTTTTWFRRIVSSGACANDTATPIQVMVTSAIANNTITGNQIICAGSFPIGLTGSLPSGGNSSAYGFRWLKSTISADVGFVNAGANDSAMNYTPPSLTANTWFKRMVFSGAGVCGNDTTNAIHITLTNSITNNTVTGNQSICSGSVPSTLSGSTPIGGNGSTYNYRWLKSTTSANEGFVNAGLNDSSINYIPTSITVTTWFKRTVKSGACAIDTSQAVQVVLNQAIANNNATGNQTICAGSLPSVISGSTPTGGNGSIYSYRWLKSNTSANAGFMNAGLNDSTINYAPTPLTATTWFKRIVTSGIGGCGPDTTNAVLVMVNNSIANNTAIGSQSICIGSTPSLITGSMPSEGNQSTYTYRWLKSTTNANTGFGNAGSNDSTINYAPNALTATTWFRRMVTSGVCENDTSAAVQVIVTHIIANNTTSGDQTICSNSPQHTLIGSMPNGGDGLLYAYKWLKSTTSAITGFENAGLNDSTISYATTTLSGNTWYKRIVTSGACASDTSIAVKLTVTNPIANNTATGAQTICSGSAPFTLYGSMPSGGDGLTFTYKWIKSTTSAHAGFVNAGSNDSTINFTPNMPTITTWYKRIVTSGLCGSDTTAGLEITVMNANIWTGLVGSDWGKSSNWLCGRVPIATDSVVIVPAINQPIISDSGRVSNSLTIEMGATLTLSNNASQLTIGGIFTNKGALVHNAGEIVFGGTIHQHIPAGAFHHLNVNNSAGVTLNGNITLKGELNLTNGIVKLGSNNLTLEGNMSIAKNASSSRYIQTNDSGNLVIQNIGSTGRTGAVFFPVGNSSYNPFTLTNVGTTDHFSIRVIDSVSGTFGGAKLTSGAVGRTWLLNEATSGGSNATVTMQWDEKDELASFNRASSHASYYNGSAWISAPNTAAYGSNPYTQTQGGINTIMAFAVGSGLTLGLSNHTMGVKISAEPNPFNTSLNVKLIYPNKENITIRIIDINGRLMAEQQAEVIAGQNNIELSNTNQLRDGMYIVMVISSKGIHNLRAVKVN